MELFFDSWEQHLGDILSRLAGLGLNAEFLPLQLETIGNVYTLAVRWLLPVLGAAILFHCIGALLRPRKDKTPRGYLYLAGGLRLPVTRWENLIGRSKYSDIVINVPTISRSHAALTYRDGEWSIVDLGSKGGMEINGIEIDKQRIVCYGDTISLAGMEMTLLPAEAGPSGRRRALPRPARPGQANHGTALFLIILFQVLGGAQIGLAEGFASPAVPAAFLLLILLECLHYGIMGILSRKRSALELTAYFLCGLNLFITASASPHSLFKQLAAITAGMIAYPVIVAVIGNLDRARTAKYILIAAGLALIILNLALGKTFYGAKNWIDLGFITFQPMEFVKVAFVLAGTATLDRLLTTRNMTAFIAFSGASIITLALINDLGTALVFFGAFVVIAFMHSGDIRTLFLILSGAAFGGLAVLLFKPHIAARFAVWGKAWQFANSAGYQQTRTMIAAASGGLLGVGGGRGFLSNIAAADTDLVFGLLCEEWGLLLALTAVLLIVSIAIYAVSLTKNCDSSFYAIAAVGAATMFLLQTTLNVLGSVDLLPLTGVTIPFVSNGGSSMVTSWGLLALIKSAERSTGARRAGEFR